MERVSGFWLSPSYKCNNRCRWCYAWKELLLSKEAKLEDLKVFIDKMVEAGAKTCVLVGGEPSVYPYIMELIAYATCKGLSVRMMSNGRKLSSYNFVLKLKEAGLEYCSISIEGPEEIHDSTTRIPGSFNQALQAIKNCQEVGIPVNSITTVSTLNINHLDDLLLVLKSINTRRAVFNMCSSQPDSDEGEDKVIISFEDYARVVERIGMAYDFVCFYALIPLCIYNQDIWPELVKLNRLKIACSLLSDSVSIDPDGFLLPCNHMPNLNYGNINDEGAIESLLKQKKEEKKFLSTHAPSAKCVDCTLWNKCHGGCNLIWFTRNAQECIPGIELKKKKGVKNENCYFK